MNGSENVEQTFSSNSTFEPPYSGTITVSPTDTFMGINFPFCKGRGKIKVMVRGVPAIRGAVD